MKTDVLFIHPGNQKRIYQALANEFTAIATPVWTTLLAGRARQRGYRAAIYDVNVAGWDERVPAELLAAHNPELVVLMVYGHNPSASTQTMPAAGRIARDLKACNRDLPIAMGGIHPSALPERTLREEAVDYVLAGEGVYTLDGLLAMLQGKGTRAAIPGLWYREGDALRSTPPAPVVPNLDDELGDYAWDLLPDLTHYRAHNMHAFQDFEKSVKPDFSDVRSPYVALNTSLGCPYACHYCCINAIFGKPGIRYWSLERVLGWMDALVTRHKVRHIRLDDELFILSPARVERFCDLLIERGYDLNLSVYGRIDTIRAPLLKKMKRAGINWISVGIESANETVRRDVNKNIKRDIETVAREMRDEGVCCMGNFMFGLPEDTRETMEETLQLAMRLNCEFINFYTVMAYPGSQLYESALTRGCLPANWDAYSQYSVDTQPLPTHHLTAAEVLRFRDEAFVRYFERPAYLEMVERRFGPKVRAHIGRMLEIKIERRLMP